ncbi:response regulator [Lysobacteraceae bacterium NML08-0793]|nr:response regulator [Xanthomonadaceae bacterium NML08-0793]
MLSNAMNLRLLLVEDDPVTQAFLSEAARALPAEVISASTAEEARQLASGQHFDAWLIDAHLPDATGATLLAQLRQSHGQTTPALAHTASQAPQQLTALEAAGFAAVIIKPLPADSWRNALRQLLNLHPENKAATSGDWDDVGALRALNGNREALETLRALFSRELPQQYQKIIAALDAADTDTALGELHRMKASCAFVGATALLQAVIALHAQPESAEARTHFIDKAEKILAA